MGRALGLVMVLLTALTGQPQGPDFALAKNA